jgi:hypothetical protein
MGVTNPRNALWQAFRDGASFRMAESDQTMTMRCEDAGSISLPSGRIVAADPILDPWRPPFSTSVPPGTYSVHLALADNDVALVMVLFQEGQPATWKKANPQSFSVDSATGCVMDYTLARFLRRKANDGKYDRYSRCFEDALAETDQWANVALDLMPDANIVLFHTLGGDGTFPVFFGYNAERQLACLVVDMLLNLVLRNRLMAINRHRPLSEPITGRRHSG